MTKRLGRPFEVAGIVTIQVLYTTGIQILDGIVEQLDNVLAIVSETAGILQGILVVEGRFKQTPGKGIVSGFFQLIDYPVAIVVDKEVRMVG